jgi:hypothetical protein
MARRAPDSVAHAMNVSGRKELVAMSMRWIVVALVIGVGVLAWVAWNGSTQKATQAQAPATAPATEEAPAMPPADGGGAPATTEATTDPGVTWDRPASWTAQSERMMRLATYTVPGPGGAGEAECAVFYFGPGQGGTVEANMERWIGEFETPAKPERSSGSVNGVAVARVRVMGTYRAHAGGMGGKDDAPAAAHQELVGAIVQAPGGSVFFKLTGPAATVDAAYPDFDRMILSLRRK